MIINQERNVNVRSRFRAPAGAAVGWSRAMRGRPCPICGKHDWCSVSVDGALAVCMRIGDNAIKATSNGGWLHRLRDTGERPQRLVRTVPVPTQIQGRDDLAQLVGQYQGNVDPARLQRLADQLGLTVASLHRLGIGWASRAELLAMGTECLGVGVWTFPMVDASGCVRGIRLRTPKGFKYALAGGHDGLFVPLWLASGGNATPTSNLTAMLNTGPLLVAEGPTDTAALLDLGFAAAGRSSCAGGVKLLVELVRVCRANDVVIVADGDKPGQRGAQALASVLAAYLHRVRVILPPPGIKDARAWKQAGVTAAEVHAAIDAAPAWSARVAGKVVSRG